MNIPKFMTVAVLLFTASITFSQAALKRANKQYELGTYNLAVQSYKDYLGKNPDNVEANSKIADCYRHLNQQEKALPHYQAAVASPEVEDLYVFQYGLTLQELGRYSLAKAVFNKLGEKSADFRAKCKQYATSCEFAESEVAPSGYKVTNEYANTASFDFGPTFFGEQVVYASGRSDIRGRSSRNAPNAGSVEGTNRLFITQRDMNGFLEVPVTLHEGFGMGANEGPASYTADGKWVVFTRNNFLDGVRMMPSSGMELNLFIATVKENGDWENALPFPHNGPDFSNGYPCFSPDGKALFFASNRPGGFGGFDLYMSVKVGDNWAAPENLGSAVNTAGNEITPYFDGSSLFFASDYHTGFGGFDIFRSEESGGNWATVYNGGSGLNSSMDDFGFIFDGAKGYGYLVSNRPGGKGSEDIYRVTKEAEILVIKVKDALTGEPISSANLDFSACGVANQLTNSNGLFSFSMNERVDCSAIVSKSGYSSETVRVASTGLTQGRTIEILLTNMANAYNGKVVNGANNNPIEDVRVIAVDENAKSEVSVYTTEKGNYTISLKPGGTYSIRYSKAGFKDFAANLKPTVADNKDLGVTSLYQVGTGGAGSQSRPAQPKDAVPTPAEMPSEPATTETTMTTVSGFAVQLAAGMSAKPDLKPYEAKVGKLGAVYSVLDAGKTKVRLGVFETKEEAVVAQSKAKEAGYTGAFIVTENGRQIEGQPKPSKPSVPAKPAPVVEEQPAKEPASTPTPSTNNSNAEGYFVKLAAYRDLKNFDQKAVESLGAVSFMKRGEFTVVLLGGFDSKASAQAALSKAQKLGYTGALVVVKDKGELKKVN